MLVGADAREYGRLHWSKAILIFYRLHVESWVKLTWHHISTSVEGTL